MSSEHPTRDGSPRRALFLSHSSSRGQTESVLSRLVCGLDKRRYHPIVVLPEGGVLKEELERAGVLTEICQLRSWSRGAADTSAPVHGAFTTGLTERVLALTNVIRRHRIDIAITNTAAMVELALAAKECGIPHVWYVHEPLSQDPSLAPLIDLKASYTLMASLSARFVAATGAVKSDIEQLVDTDTITVLHSGISVPDWPAPSRDELFGFEPGTQVIGFLGPLSKRSGVGLLVDVATLVLDVVPSARFVVVGPDRGALGELNEAIRAKGVGRAFSLLGARDDALDILRASDVLAAPSPTDPLSSGILEAMAAGLPVVAARAGGVEDIVVDETTGRLVPANDAEAMSHAIVDVLTRPSLRAALGRNAKRRSDELFAHDGFVRKFEAILDATPRGGITEPWGVAAAILVESTAAPPAPPAPLAQLPVPAPPLPIPVLPDHLATSLAFRGLQAFWKARDNLLPPGTRAHARYSGVATRLKQLGEHVAAANLRATLYAARLARRDALYTSTREPFQVSAPAISTRAHHFALYSSSAGNAYFNEMRGLLAAGLKELAFEVSLADERAGFLPGADWHVVVAPHEFFVLGAGPSLARADLPTNLILVTTEQLGSHWFNLAARFFPRAKAIWDIDYETSQSIARDGFRGCHLALGYAPSFEGFGIVSELPDKAGTRGLAPHVKNAAYCGGRLSQRPLDIAFFGTLSKRRADFFAQNSRVFANYDCFLWFHDLASTLGSSELHLDTRSVIGLEQRSRIVLNVHREDVKFFEWHRIVMHGIWQGALVISEPCAAAPPFRPGVDYIEASLNDLAEQVRYYLSDSRGQEEAQSIADSGYRTLTQSCRMRDTLEKLLASVVRGEQP